MRWLVLLVLLPLAGCVEDAPAAPPEPPAPEITPCEWGSNVTLFLGPEHTLQNELPASGRAPGNGFDEAFLNNDLDEWLAQPAADFMRINGTIELEFWTDGNNMPAPIVIGGDPGEGYHFFNQIGTNGGFIESYAIEYASVVAQAGVVRYVEQFEATPGGLFFAPGDQLRLLLTNLVADDAEGSGPDILYGEAYPSALRFKAECIPALNFTAVEESSTPIAIPFHHGLLTGAVPAQDGVNHQDIPFSLNGLTERLTIAMAQTGGPNPLKDDMDISVKDANGVEVWSIGSPYSDEIGTLWPDNLEAMMPPGEYVVRINSYSGHGYEGRLKILQEALA